MKGSMPIEKLIAFLIVLAILVILVTIIIPRVEIFKELFTNLLEKFK